MDSQDDADYSKSQDGADIDIEESSRALFNNIFADMLDKIKDTQKNGEGVPYMTQEQFKEAINQFHEDKKKEALEEKDS